MPASRLTTSPIPMALYDVVGRDSPNSNEFVSHLGLTTEALSQVAVDTSVSVTDMRPPLTENQAEWPIQTLGTVPLTSDQREQVRVFLDEQLGEYVDQRVGRLRQYTIHPHVRRPTADCSYHRYSCVGLVIEADRNADVDLVVTDETQLPRVSLELLQQAYPDLAAPLELEGLRKKFGLMGDGPWPVVLAGYGLHSLARSGSEILNSPYQPQPGEERFPRREH